MVAGLCMSIAASRKCRMVARQISSRDNELLEHLSASCKLKIGLKEIIMATVLAGVAAAAVLRAVAAPIVGQAAKGLKTTSDKLRARLESSFSNHLQITYKRCSEVKTIFSGNSYVPLESIYVNLYLSCNGKICRDEDIVTIFENKNAVIIGTGGAGKTMMMRHLALTMYKNPNGKIPIFIELRSLPVHKPSDFYRCIFDMVTPERNQLDYPVFL